MKDIFIRSWRSLAFRGAVALVFGLTALLWPGLTLVMLVLLFGIYALLDGIVTVALGSRNLAREHGWVLFLEGCAGVGLGLAVLLWIRVAAELLVVLIALWAIGTGVLELIAAVRLRRELPEEMLLGIAGVVSVLLGIAILAWPGTATIALAILLGSYAVIFGTSMLIQALRLRRLRHGTETSHRHMGSRPRPA